MDDLRIKAMDYALAARANAEEDVVELAQRIYQFLEPHVAIELDPASYLVPLDRLGVKPPPIPDLVQQVASDAKPSQLGPESLSSAPPGFRGEMPDLSNADQSPRFDMHRLKELAPRAEPEDDARVARFGTVAHAGIGNCKPDDDDTKTRIISRT